MSPGYITVQCIHAVTEFYQEHPALHQNWQKFSKAITLLAVKNEDELKILIKQLTEKSIPLSIFIEPDINNQVTAIAIAPSLEAKKLCSSIPLALKEYNKPQQINKHFTGINLNGPEGVVICQ